MGSLRSLRQAAGETRAGLGEVGKPVWLLEIEESCSFPRSGSCSVSSRSPKLLGVIPQGREIAKAERATAKQVVRVGPIDRRAWPSIHPAPTNLMSSCFPILIDPPSPVSSELSS